MESIHRIVTSLPTDPASLFVLVLSLAAVVVVIVAGSRTGKGGPPEA